ncbi:DMT family transporter [Vibrio viridaestus]|uniref:DMT family transporter n=1 Tax=Vibrio viridaestus TaxID=2487322 RepID=A0A3N9U1W1_9VIBR|nr:DMT family transporter [Vibrio viridaestus]
MTLITFAANSVLCRLALQNGAIDALNFTTIRLVSGAIVLMLIVSIRRSVTNEHSRGSWRAGGMLFLYAITFSYAYNSLSTGTGALILFASVQLTMLIFSYLKGTRLSILEWCGVIVAFGGFVFLVLPDISSPSASGFLLMTIAGVAWGFYTLLGKHSRHPLHDTTYNFLRTLPFVVIAFAATFMQTDITVEGMILATLSGSIASAGGYTVWYIALRGLNSTQAAVIQLLVPVFAALGGIMFANEVLTTRFIISTLLILGGLMLVALEKKKLS